MVKFREGAPLFPSRFVLREPLLPRGHLAHAHTGAIVRSLQSDRFVTGVTWVQGELWHGTLVDDASELREIDPQTGVVRRRIALPHGSLVSGLESNGADAFFCGGATSGKLRAVRRSERRKR